MEARSCSHCCSGKAISITYSESVFVALGIQQVVMCMRQIMWPALLYKLFPHYLINSTFFDKKKVTEHKMFVLVFSIQLLYETFLILRII